MLLKEIFEGLGDEGRGAELAWRNQMENPSTFALADARGKIIRPGLSKVAAQALSVRPDLIKKYGKLFIVKG